MGGWAAGPVLVSWRTLVCVGRVGLQSAQRALGVAGDCVNGDVDSVTAAADESDGGSINLDLDLST